ncbi:MAG: hypothetical protein ACE14S_04650 [Candidatus Bathyarchaeia archaeon]
MSTRLKEKEERLLEILNGLVEESAKGTPVVVEGKKDIETLRVLGVAGPILSVKTGGKSFADAMQEIECSGAREVVLLLDFDRRGKQGTKRLQTDLERANIKPNMVFWRALSGLLRREVQCVESLTAYLENLRRQVA